MTESVVFESVGWDDPRAVDLRTTMDAELVVRYPQLAGATSAGAALSVRPDDVLATVLVVEPGGRAVAHAALRRHDGDWEVKRVIVERDQRGRGLGRALMVELERIARDGGASRLILHTGNRQPEAVALYEDLGYQPMPLYEPYRTAMPNSFCFEKALT